MYRVKTYQRVISRIHKLRRQQRLASSFTERNELGVRIENLKNLIILNSDQS